MPDGIAFCPGCGRRMIDAPSTVGSTGFLKENVAGALAYLTFIPALIFLWIMPFKRNHFVRFHSLQSIFFAIAIVVAAVVMRILFAVLAVIPAIGFLVGWLAVILVALAWVITWLVVMVKALQGELFKLPWIGHMAERG
jgi:uncharacterized membrane protein